VPERGRAPSHLNRDAADDRGVLTLALRLGLTPLLVVAVGALERRWGRAAGGALAGLPLTSVSVMLVLALGSGPGFAAATAHTAAWGALVQGVLCRLYGGVAAGAAARGGPRGRGIALALGACAVVFAVVVAVGPWVLAVAAPPLLLAPLMAVVVAVVSLWRWPRSAGGTRGDRTGGWSSLVRRCLAAEALTVTVALLAPMVGPGRAGLIGALPALALTVAVAAHREAGAAEAREALRAVVATTPAVAVFLAGLAVGLDRLPMLAAFALAAGAALVVAAIGARTALVPEPLLLSMVTTRSWTSRGRVPTMRS
jgi:hypothetical protein